MAIPIVVGQKWKRRIEKNEPFDVIEICGLRELGKDLPDEYCVRDVDGHTAEITVRGESGPVKQQVATISTTPANLEAAFTLVSQPPAPMDWETDNV
jgi:hypothetical protein